MTELFILGWALSVLIAYRVGTKRQALTERLVEAAQ